MHAFLEVLSVLALAATTVSARAFTNHVSRSTTDVCAEIDEVFTVPSPVGGKPIVIGKLDICLCLSGIPALFQANSLVISAEKQAGSSAVTAALTSMVNSASGSKKCAYPDNATPQCDKGNPCGFGCKSGFTASPLSKPVDCICPPPFSVCFGVCGLFKGCPSAHPKKRELDLESRSRAGELCRAGETACGVWGWTSGRAQAWECVDAMSDLESCGGCTVPLHLNSPHGVDCTAIPGVADVSCAAGACAVHRCLPGYQVSYDGTMCVRTAQGPVLGFTPAAEFGLEHIPLKRGD